MATGKPRDLAKQQRWRHLLEQWQASGLTVAAFCRRQRLAQASFYAWRRTLRERERQTAARPRFLTLAVEADASVAPGQAFELVLARGRRLRIPVAFDPAALRQLLAVLEHESC